MTGSNGTGRTDGIDERGQTELVGVVLLIGLTIIGTTAIVAFGTATIADSREASELRSTEHAMTLFDSKAANVALGESPVRSVQFGRTGGQFEVREDVGSMRIEHHTEGEEEPVEWEGCGTERGVCEVDLGAMVYTHGGAEIAYQGGGVWRHEGGGTTMVSPPEFHYRGETLTLPVVATSGEGSAGGGPMATLRPGSEDGSAPAYAGAIENGTVSVTVESPYYRGWERYFEERTNGNVSVDREAESATVELVSTETQGEFTMSGNGDEIRIRGLVEEESVNEFDLTLYPNVPGQGASGRSFNPFEWGFSDPDSSFDLLLWNDGDDVGIEVTDADGGETWRNDAAFAIEEDEHGDEYVEVVLVPEGDGPMLEGDASGEERPLGEVVGSELYAAGPNVDLEIYDQGQGGGSGSDRVDYEVAFGYIDYESSGQFIAYLHVTENEVEVRLS
ncbi:DUF7289 family protein [Halalkalicoccus tibetensis]|uniref:Flagellin N-terminal-like domain-containing protein n=1 Tax=Halalkalicoccus tibetensis TaxID=175632 RepID=A0ABD5V3W4_9EURY